jgi:predicted 3-demethylubiquinone-9 3-methyltransferase (glyoxalase superfamily)
VNRFTELMSDPDPGVSARAFAAMMEMERLDVDAFRAAAGV